MTKMLDGCHVKLRQHYLKTSILLAGGGWYDNSYITKC